METNFKDSDLLKFWINLREEYPEITAQAMKVLMRFPTTYFCEKTFSLYAATKTRPRSKMNAESEMKLHVTEITPDFEKLCNSKKQMHFSH